MPAVVGSAWSSSLPMITLGLRLVQPSSPPSYLAHLSLLPLPSVQAQALTGGWIRALHLPSSQSCPLPPPLWPPPPPPSPGASPPAFWRAALLRTLPSPHRVPCCPFCSSALCTHHSLPFVSLPGRVEASGRQGSCSVFILRAQNDDWQIEGTHHCLLNE